MARQKKKLHYTPKGTARYPYLNKPDFGNEDFPDPDGSYKVDLIVDPETEGAKLEAFRAQAQEVLDDFVEERSKSLKPADKKKATIRDLFIPEEDDEGEETGRLIIRAKLKANVNPKNGDPFTQRPGLVDATGKKQLDPEEVLIGGGSVLKLAVQFSPYWMAKDKQFGLSYRLKAAQVLELKSFGDGGTYGFDAEDDYVDEDEETDNGFEDESDNGPEEDEDF